MKRLLLFAFLLSSFLANAKTDELSTEIVRRAKTFRTPDVLAWIDSLNTGKIKPAKRHGKWEVEIDSSQLIGDYWEITLSFYLETPKTRDKKNSALLLAHGAELVSATVDNAKPYEAREVYLDSTLQERWAPLSDAWKKAYGVELKAAAFLYPTDAYGTACGFVAISPVRRSLMLGYVEKSDIASLTSWLQSPIPDKQCYAVEGFYMLKQLGTPLTPQQLAMIDAAKQRQALVVRCAGCIYGLERQDVLLAGFAF